MRKPTLLLLLGPAALALLPLTACENDSPGGAGPNLSMDGSVATFDATTSPFDATTPDAPAGPSVSVTVDDSRGPKAGVRIVFHDANGAVIETKLTGADGKATHTGPTPSMASALLAAGQQPHIVTWTGVEDGDELHVRDEDTEEMIGIYQVTFSSFEDSGANQYFVASPCGTNMSYGTATELPLYRRCAGSQNAVLATGRRFSGNVTGHSFKKGNATVSDGGTGAITLGDWKAPSTLMVNVENDPADGSFDARLLEVADGAGFASRLRTAEGSHFTFSIATGFADAYQASIAATDATDSLRTIAKRFAPSASVTLDYAGLLPSIDDASLDTSNPRRPVVSWTAGSSAGTDGGLVQLSFLGSQNTFRYWTLIVPPGSNTVTAPEMPAEADSFLPFAPDSGMESYFRVPEVLFLEADFLPSYASFRSRHHELLGLPRGFYDFNLPALPTNGTCRTTRSPAIGM